MFCVRPQPKKHDNRMSSGGVGERWIEKILKRGGAGLGNIGGLHKIRGLAPLCQLCKETLQIFHPPPHYKTNPPPPIPSFFPFLVKVSIPLYCSHLKKKFIPPLWRGRWGEGFGLWSSSLISDEQSIALHLKRRDKLQMFYIEAMYETEYDYT